MEFAQMWWSSPDGEVFRELTRHVKALEEQQSDVHERNLRHAWLYNNCRLNGMDVGLNAGPWPLDTSPATENLVESVIDTATSMIGKNRPKCTFVTDGADFTTQRKAKRLERFVEAEFHRLKIYELAAKVFRDACVWGTGGLVWSVEDGRVYCERVLIDEIIVDEEECKSGSPPTSIYRRKFVDKDWLKARYPDKKDEIDAASSLKEREWTYFRTVPYRQVAIVEGYHLPTDDAPGRHTIAISTADLLDEEWNHDWFPYTWYRWSDPLQGFYGRGLAEQLAPVQMRVNKLNKFIARCQDLIAVPRIFAHISDANAKQRFTNEIGTFVYYHEKPPQVETPQAVTREVYEYKEQLKEGAYQMAGISRLSASAQKPVGLDSAVALREYNNIETERFAIQAQAYEAFHLECGRMIVTFQKQIGGGVTAVWRTRNLIQKIEWSSVNLDEDVYSMGLEASSIMSRSPAGRMQQVVDLAQAGLIQPAEARRLLGHPDIDRAMDLETAAIEDIEAVIEKLLDGEWDSPEPFQDLALGVRMVQQAYLKARREGAPQDILEGMIEWVENAQEMLAKGQGAQQAQQAPVVPFQAGLPAVAGAPPGGGLAPGAPPPSAPPPAM